ncbi:hypothetical protein FB45DRAFT_896499 [Roridomyces roridus]|uniref:Cupredoxin n=1 Tax=Roridomyces roridus TaxID=1738132 RepID=A0AAD7CAV5_9AGAR|nr:hypothetical protein FB45DRAFT_896499 [Roridomyces roridus]
MHFLSLATAAAAVLTTASAATITVLVGSNGTTLALLPTFPRVGDQIAFQLFTVTQSTFKAPCTASGITSGFQPFVAGSTQVAQWSFTITNASVPLWFYCQRSGHCPAGMVFSVNAPATGNTFDAFKTAAIATGTNASATTGAATGAAAGAAAGASASGTPAPSSALITRSSTVGVLAVTAGLLAGLVL